MSILTRRNFLGTVAAAGGLTALQKVVGADHPSDPGPANAPLDGQNPDSIGLQTLTRRAWCKTSSATEDFSAIYEFVTDDDHLLH